MSLAELFCMAPPIYPFSVLSDICVVAPGQRSHRGAPQRLTQTTAWQHFMCKETGLPFLLHLKGQQNTT